MPDYTFGRIKRLDASLREHGIPADTIERIMEGGETITPATKPERKADWTRDAMLRMDALLDLDTRRSVREGCACCLGGKRLQVSRSIAREHATLDDRIAAANEATFVFGHSVTMQEDGRILVSFQGDGFDRYACACVRKAREPISVTYCYCCGGHAKHHLQIALGHKLSCEVRSSALSSGGEQLCTFLFTIVD